MSTFKKPVLRRLHHQQALKQVIGGVTCSITAAITFYLAYVRPQRKAYEKFYEDYDGEAEFEKMVAAGVISSVKPKKK